MKRQSGTESELFIQHGSGKNYRVELQKSLAETTIKDVKDLYKRKSGYHGDVKISIGSRPLENDDANLEQEGVVNGCTLFAAHIQN